MSVSEQVKVAAEKAGFIDIEVWSNYPRRGGHIYGKYKGLRIGTYYDSVFGAEILLGNSEFLESLHTDAQARENGWPSRIGIERTGRCEFIGTSGWKLSKDYAAKLEVQLQRLRETLCVNGWDVHLNLYAWRHSVSMAAGAFLHMYVNGVGGHGYDGIRRFADDIGVETRSPGPCVSEVMELLPKYIDDVIALFNTYPDPIRGRDI